MCKNSELKLCPEFKSFFPKLLLNMLWRWGNLEVFSQAFGHFVAVESSLRTYSSQVFKCISDEYGCVRAAAAWTYALLQQLGDLQVYMRNLRYRCETWWFGTGTSFKRWQFWVSILRFSGVCNYLRFVHTFCVIWNKTLHVLPSTPCHHFWVFSKRLEKSRGPWSLTVWQLGPEKWRLEDAPFL